MITSTAHYYKKKSLIAFVLLAFIAFISLPSSGFSFLIITILLTIFVINKPFINRKVVLFVSPLAGILLVGTIMGLGSLFNENSYMFLKDVYYFSQPILIILLGCYVASAKINTKNLFKLIIYGALIGTFYNLFSMLVGLIQGDDLNLSLRYQYGLKGGLPLFGFIVVYASKVSNFRLFKLRHENTLLVFFFLATAVSFSRVDILILFIIILIPVLVRILGARMQLLLVSTIIVILSFFGSVISVQIPEYEATNFMEKVVNSYSEAIVRDVDIGVKGPSNVNNYWRAQEAFLGVSKYLEGNNYQLIFGQGMGSFTSGDMFFDNKYKVIPFFHNGYVTILLKTGVIGLLLFFSFIYSILRVIWVKSASKVAETKFYEFLSISVVYSIVLKTWFVMGLYTPIPIYLVLLLTGILIQLKSESHFNKFNFLKK